MTTLWLLGPHAWTDVDVVALQNAKTCNIENSAAIQIDARSAWIKSQTFKTQENNIK